MFPFCYHNGKITSTQKVLVPVNDLGLIRGFAVFDYFLVFNGKPFRIDEHLVRFFRSAKGMELKVPIPMEKIKTVLTALIKINKVANAGVRLLLTGGESADGFNRGKPNFIITIEPAAKVEPAWYTQGIKLISHEHLREFPEIKTTNYLTGIVLQKERKKRKADDVLYTYQGTVLECIRNNFFIVKNQTLITPKNNILIGITRNAVLKLAKNKYKIEERDLSYTELTTADEAFITSTTKQICPVVKVDKINIGNGKVGVVTKDLMNIMEVKIAAHSEAKIL